METKNKKIPESCMRVLELFKLLLQKPCQTGELLKVIEDYSDDVFSKDTISKYINTLKLAGFDVVKEKDVCFLQKSLEKINLSPEQLSVILFIKKHLKDLNKDDLTEQTDIALQILERGFSDETIELAQSGKIKTFKLKRPVQIDFENTKKFEKFCKENLKLTIKYKKDKSSSEEQFKISPQKVVHRNGKAFLIGHNYITGEFTDFLIKNITEAAQQPQQSGIPYPSGVAFILRNRLKKAYVLKYGEEVKEIGKNYCIVANFKEDREVLLRRLLRYGTDCEILYPVEYKQKMKEFVHEMVDYYEKQ